MANNPCVWADVATIWRSVFDEIRLIIVNELLNLCLRITPKPHRLYLAALLVGYWQKEEKR